MRIAPTSSAEPSAAAIQPALDWFLFGVTVIGAAVVYIALFNGSWIGFVVGEAICGSIWMGGVYYKWKHGRKQKTSAKTGQL